MAVLVALIFLMSNTTGGLFEHRLLLRSYFGNAAGLKDGAPVTLEGVTIGNVIHVRVVPDRDPTPVEVTMQVGQKFRHLLHVDSTSMISQSGVLGDSYVDISSINASGPAPPENAELRTTGAPSIQQVITSSDISIKQINTLMKKVETLVDTLNSGAAPSASSSTIPSFTERLPRSRPIFRTSPVLSPKARAAWASLLTTTPSTTAPIQPWNESTR
jgi:phospholipid/cholesterol/gamma-HCH transport system substrate-binding protein